jgi:UDP-glucose 4-epimerase
MKKILITGSNGYIAKRFIEYGSFQYNIEIINRDVLDLTNSKSTDIFLKNKEFDAVLHFASVGGHRLIGDKRENVFENLIMFENLRKHKNKFNKFISFGSGAEIFYHQTPYGLSKKIINELIKNESNFFNLRIFAVFDEFELNSRFIKTNIIKNIKKEPMIIHQNKLFDFFYMEDLLNVINYYINSTEKLIKVFDCCYKNKFTLHDIANKINSLNSSFASPIIVENHFIGDPYTGNYTKLPSINYIGLKNGIKKTYNKIYKNQLEFF